MSFVFLPAPLCDPGFALGLGLDPEAGRAFTLSDYTVAITEGAAVPGLREQPGGICEGQLLPLSSQMQTEVFQTLSAAGCDLTEETAEAQTLLLPMARCGQDLDAARWRTRMLPVWVEALPDMRASAQRFDAAGLAARLPTLLSRAHSRVMARTHPRSGGGGFTSADVTLDAQSQPYTEFFAVDEYVLRHRTFAGGMTPPLRRAAFLAADAVTVLPYDPVRDCVLLVEQFRAGPYARGDGNPWLLEPVAGRIEPGDTAEETARKEAREEAGLDLGTLHRIGGYYPSTGCFSEYLVSYIGIADLPDRIEGLHGVEGEGEDIRTHVLPRTDLLARIAAGEMPDAPLLLSAYWLELNRARLLAG